MIAPQDRIIQFPFTVELEQAVVHLQNFDELTDDEFNWCNEVIYADFVDPGYLGYVFH